MPIMYNKLFHLLIDLGMKKKDLQEQAGITKSIMARLAKNQTVRTDTIEKICCALQCQPGDIMEYLEHETYIDMTTGSAEVQKRWVKPILYKKDTENISD